MLRIVATGAALTGSPVLRILEYFRNNAFATWKAPHSVRMAI